VPIHVFLGIGVWFRFQESGVHAAIAGVIVGLLTPVRPWVIEELLVQFVHKLGGLYTAIRSEMLTNGKPCCDQ